MIAEIPRSCADYFLLNLVGMSATEMYVCFPFDTNLGVHAPFTVLTLVDSQRPRESYVCVYIYILYTGICRYIIMHCI